MPKKKPSRMETVLMDLSGNSDEDLRSILDELYAEEERISYERRILHGKIDILRAELTERLKQRRARGQSVISASDLDKLTDILAREAYGMPRSDLFGEDKSED